MEKEKKMGVVAAATAEIGTAAAPPNIKRALAMINKLQAQRGKRELSAEEVIIRPVRMVGDQIMSHYVAIKTEDLKQIAKGVPGTPLLIGHDTEMAPKGTFFHGVLTAEGDATWVDGWFYMLNNDEGRAIAEKIDSGIINEASIGWMFTEAICSICGRDYFGSPDAEGNVCAHFAGEKYDGQTCFVYTTGDVKLLEVSLVYRGAHPGTRVGGDFAQRMAAAAGASTIESLVEAKRARQMVASRKEGTGMEKEQKAYVPPNPSGYSKDESLEWSKPRLQDFLKALGMDEGTAWEDIPKADRRWIASAFAYAPSSDPDSYTFTDLKLPHHRPESGRRSVLVWGGVRAAAQRLPNTDIPESEVPAVQRHLGAHYREFDRTAPWDENAAQWDEYVSVVGRLKRGYVVDDLLRRAAELSQAFFGEEPKKEEAMEDKKLVVEIDGQSIEAADANELAGKIREAMAAAVEKATEAQAKEIAELKAKLEEMEKAKASLEARAALGDKYVEATVEEIRRLSVAVDGEEGLEAMMKAVKLLAEQADIDSLVAVRDRLQRRLNETVPAGRVSKEAGEEAMVTTPPPSLLEGFKTE